MAETQWIILSTNLLYPIVPPNLSIKPLYHPPLQPPPLNPL
jgi:hypothetical protein